MNHIKLGFDEYFFALGFFTKNKMILLDLKMESGFKPDFLKCALKISENVQIIIVHQFTVYCFYANMVELRG